MATQVRSEAVECLKCSRGAEGFSGRVIIQRVLVGANESQLSEGERGE